VEHISDAEAVSLAVKLQTHCDGLVCLWFAGKLYKETYQGHSGAVKAITTHDGFSQQSPHSTLYWESSECTSSRDHCSFVCPAMSEILFLPTLSHFWFFKTRKPIQVPPVHLQLMLKPGTFRVLPVFIL
jgi:hypothetical protein